MAEVRTVEIAWQVGLEFVASSMWSGARYEWMVTGGSLVTRGDRVVWQPPQTSGRYLLQVAADWGRHALAVDAVVLVIEEDGSIVLC